MRTLRTLACCLVGLGVIGGCSARVSGLPGDGTADGDVGGSLGRGCGSGGGGAEGGPADLFPCDSPWYRDVSGAPVAPVSAHLMTALAARGFGPDIGGDLHRLQVNFSYTLLHANASAPKRPVEVMDWPTQSDLLLQPKQGFPVPTPPGGVTQGMTDYTCPRDSSDCHTVVVDDERHLLYELYASSLVGGIWKVSQETVWNLAWHYPASGRGLSCTSADAAGLAISPGIIGLREMLTAAKTRNADLHHALRFILPNNRIAAAWVAPGTHLTTGYLHPTNGIPFGTRLRLRADFDENQVLTPGGKVLVRTLKRYGMILADGGNIAFTAESEHTYRAKDASLTWNGTLGARDLEAIPVRAFDVVDWDPSTFHLDEAADRCVVSPAPLSGVLQ